MAQPIRHKIIEVHSEMIKEEAIYTLLIDGNSLLFSSFADPKINSDGVHYGGIFQFLLQIRLMLQKKVFDYIYVFFDNEFSGYMRYEKYRFYKSNRDKNYAEYGVSDFFTHRNSQSVIIRSVFPDIHNKITIGL